MKRKKPRVKYQGISFETPFIAEIKKHIMFNSRYRSIADFAREAIRGKMEEDQSEAMEVFSNKYRRIHDDELAKELIHEKNFSNLSLDEIKRYIVFFRELKMIEIKEMLQEKKEISQGERTDIKPSASSVDRSKREPILQLSKNELTDMIQSVVTKTLDKKEKKE